MGVPLLFLNRYFQRPRLFSYEFEKSVDRLFILAEDSPQFGQYQRCSRRVVVDGQVPLHLLYFFRFDRLSDEINTNKLAGICVENLEDEESGWFVQFRMKKDAYRLHLFTTVVSVILWHQRRRTGLSSRLVHAPEE